LVVPPASIQLLEEAIPYEEIFSRFNARIELRFLYNQKIPLSIAEFEFFSIEGFVFLVYLILHAAGLLWIVIFGIQHTAAPSHCH